MHDILPAGRSGLLAEPRRNKYFYGKLLDVAHLQMEQSYFNRKRWLLNRLSLGEGVLCGLDVQSRKGQLCVTRGVAIDSLGREIIVPTTVCIDPWKPTDDCGPTEPALSADESHDAYLCLEYKECAADFLPVLATECETRDQCAAGTTVESFRLSLHLIREGDPEPLTPRPKSETCAALRGGEAADKIEQLCEALSELPCEPPASPPCVTLARVTLNARATPEEPPTIGDIETCSVRPMAYSNALLFDMILCLAARIDECCAPANPVITRIWPANGIALSAEEDLKNLFSPDKGLELTFDRKMDGAKLGAPDPWLGLWLVRTPPPTTADPDPPVTALRLKLTAVAAVPTPSSAKIKYALDLSASGSTSVIEFGTRAFGGGGSGRDPELVFLVVINSKGTAITDESGKALDADFVGTGLDFAAVGVSPDAGNKKLFDALWEMKPGDSRRFDSAQFAKKPMAATPPALPAKGSGDGSPGGLFHSAFKAVMPSS